MSRSCRHISEAAQLRCCYGPSGIAWPARSGLAGQPSWDQ
jgi:hypothetical protein